MLRTLRPADRVLVDRLAYHWRQPRRLELVLFAVPDSVGSVSGEAIKRLVGLPGETLRLTPAGLVIDGQALDEPYLAQAADPAEYHHWQLGADQFLLLSDNRPEGTDGRHFGPLHRRALLGPIWWRYEPLTRSGTVT